MSDEQISESDLQAYVDGKLPDERSAAVQAWLDARPEEAERMAFYKRLGEELRATYDPVLAEPVPSALEHAASRRPRWRAVMAYCAALALAAVLGGVAGWQLHGARSAGSLFVDTAVIARRAAVAHATFAPEVRHPVEVGADQEEHLLAWLSKRLGVKLRAPKLDEAGMSLVGGRLLPGESGPVAQFMYQTQAGRRLTLYWRPEVGAHRETAFRYARENNIGVFYWIDEQSGYAIASADLSKEELLRIATLVHKQLER